MRTFVAVEISNEAILGSIAKLQSDLKIQAKPINKENMHFTLLFLGEISEELAPKIIESLNSVLFKPIDLDLIGVGAFPNPMWPRVVWIGVDEDGAKNLVELAKQVEEKLSPLGFRNDKPFKPHLTIFRLKNQKKDISRELAKFSDLKVGHQTISELKFKKSILTPSGPIYSDLQVVRARQ